MEWNHRCANGLRVYGATNEHLHGFCIGIYILAGSMYEGERENGITHLFEHCVFRNLKKRYDQDFYELLTRHGLVFNACTYKEFVSFEISGLPSGLPFAAELMEKMFLPFDLTAEEYRTEKQRIKAEIREESETTTLNYLLNKKAWNGTSLERTIAGTCGGVERISRKQLAAFRERFLTAGNMLVYLTGKVPQEVLPRLLTAAERIPAYQGTVLDNTAPVPADFGRRQQVVHRKASSYHYLALAFDIDNARFSAGIRDLLYSVLFEGEDALFYQQMSERTGLVYSVDSTLEQYRNISKLSFRFEVARKDIPAALRELGGLFRMLREGAFSFENCLQKQLTKWELMRDDPCSLNWSMAYENHILGAEPVEPEKPRFGRYQGITKEDLMAAAGEIFRRENLTFAVKGNVKALRDGELWGLLDWDK